MLWLLVNRFIIGVCVQCLYSWKYLGRVSVLVGIGMLRWQKILIIKEEEQRINSS